VRQLLDSQHAMFLYFTRSVRNSSMEERTNDRYDVGPSVKEYFYWKMIDILMENRYIGG
jgi:hypothetical protein